VSIECTIRQGRHFGAFCLSLQRTTRRNKSSSHAMIFATVEDRQIANRCDDGSAGALRRMRHATGPILLAGRPSSTRVASVYLHGDNRRLCRRPAARRFRHEVVSSQMPPASDDSTRSHFDPTASIHQLSEPAGGAATVHPGA